MRFALLKKHGNAPDESCGISPRGAAILFRKEYPQDACAGSYARNLAGIL